MRSFSRLFTTRSDRTFLRLFCRALCVRIVFSAVTASLFSAALLPLSADDALPLQFTEVTRKARLKFRHNFGAKRLGNVLMTTASGCAMFDYDNDGWLDICLLNGTHLDKQGNVLPDEATHHALFRNRGDGTFENVTEAAGLNEPSYGQGCFCGDYDGDGFTDLYITNYGPNRLYRNRGDGTFEDVTEQSGTGEERYSTGAVFFDYDGDGDLDLFVVNHLKFRPDMKGVHASALSKAKGFPFFPGPRDYEGVTDVMFRNNGDGTFTDVSEEVGLAPLGKGLTAVAADLDDDGDQDLFVPNDSVANFFYRNDGGRFTEIALEAGVAYDPDGVTTAGMGTDVADVDGDGKLDLYVTNMVFEFNNMYQNLGDMIFEDVTKILRMDKDNYRHVSWGIRFVDFNHDGHLDCFVANGHLVDYIEGFSQSITYRQRNMLFLGNDDGGFENVADRIGEAFLKKRVSKGAAFGDYDNDGDIDILILNSGEYAQLLRNDLPPNDRWVKVRLKGRPPNTHGIGARVWVRFGDRVYMNEVRFAGAYLSSSDPTLHVGLSPGIAEVDVEVAWPSGKRSVQKANAGTLVVIEEPATTGAEGRARSDLR